MNGEVSVKNGVLFGQEGWLYLWLGGQRQFDYLTSKLSPSPSSIENFAANIASRSDYCEQRALPYVHVVYPSKPVTMDMYLPETLAGQVTSLFEAHYRDRLPEGIRNRVIYPRDALKAEAATRAVFKTRDTHMTDYGNAFVARAILRSLGEDHDPLMHLQEQDRPQVGDLARMAEMTEPVAETEYQSVNNVEQSWDNRPFLPGNTDNIVIVHNPASTSTKRLLAIGDSFLRDALTPLATFYRDILYLRSEHFQPDAVDSFAPDAIVTANAERYLCQVASDREGASILWKCYGRPDYHPSADFVSALRAQLSRSTYPDRYKNWAAGVRRWSFEGIGSGEPNTQLVAADDDPEGFVSLGKDPRIIFRKTRLANDLAYRISLSMESEVAGKFQIFYDDGAAEGRPSFSESASVSADIEVGSNLVECVLPAGRLNSLIRIDPLNCEGRFRIVSSAAQSL